MSEKKQPSPLELQVLSVLWENGPATVRAVLDRMPDGKQRAYTTILSILQGLEKKELVTKTSEGTAHVYTALSSRKKIMAPMFKDMVRNFFSGNPVDAMQQLLDTSKLSDDELDQIDQLLEERRKRGKRS